MSHDKREQRALNPHDWIESATFCPATPLGSMSFKLNVPEPPQRPGGLIYLFAGAENMQMTTVIQPVLQWGYNGHFGGDYWCIAAWWAKVDGSHQCSNHIQVNPGDVLKGTIEVQCWSEYACRWLISMEDQSLGQSVATNLETSSLFLFLIGGALEAYQTDRCGSLPSVPRCDQYPASKQSTFYEITLKDLAGRTLDPSWDRRSFEGNQDDNCDFHVDMNQDHIRLKY